MTVLFVLVLAAIVAIVAFVLLRGRKAGESVLLTKTTVSAPSLAPSHVKFPIPEREGVQLERGRLTSGSRVAYWSAPQCRWVWTTVVGWKDHRKRHLILQADHRPQGDVFLTRYTHRRFWLTA